jgi:hypothetical protein
MNLNAHTARIAHQASSTSILPVRHCGIGILPMIHGLEGAPQRGILRWGPHDKPGPED